MNKNLKNQIFLAVLLFAVIGYFALHTSNKQEVSLPIEIVDQEGYKTILQDEPQRIVSMMPSNTEILFALGLGEKVVGVTNYCDYPAEALTKVKVGDINFDFERIVGLEPDLILATSGMGESVDTLRELGLNVVVVDPQNLDDVLESILWIAGFTGQEEKGKEIVKDLEERIGAVKKITEQQAVRPKVFYEVWDDPLMTAGPGTFIHDLITVAGGRNIGDSLPTQWSAYSLESLLVEDPEVIFVTWDDLTVVYDRANWQSIKAIQNKRVVWLDQNLVSRPGPRIVEALEEIQRALFIEKD